MTKHITLGKLNLTFVLRYRFEKRDRFDMEFRRWELSLWFRKNRIVGRKDFKEPKKWKDNLVGSYMIGVELLLFKVWVNFNFGGMYLKY